jgi:hypothetical protein
MNRKPLCKKCNHTATQHANVKYKNKKGEERTYTNCRVCECKAYEPTTATEKAPENTKEPTKEA